MTNKHINPSKPEDIVNEIFSENSESLKAFSDNFSKEILTFSESYSNAYSKYRQFSPIVKDEEQIAYVAGFIYLILDNLITSMKLLVSGYIVPSGNLMRQAIESVAVAILCAERNEIRIGKKKNRIKKIDYYKLFKSDSSKVRSHMALSQLKMNSQDLGVNDESIDALEKSRVFYHKFSHPGKLALGSSMSFSKLGEMFLGGGFDDGKIEVYKIELNQRIIFCNILPNLIDAIVVKIKN